MIFLHVPNISLVNEVISKEESITFPPMMVSKSKSMSCLVPPKPGVLIAQHLSEPFTRLTTRPCIASPSISLAITRIGRPVSNAISNGFINSLIVLNVLSAMSISGLSNSQIILFLSETK